MARMEHLINVHASKAAKGSIAEFLGYCEVEAHEANRLLTTGLWLVWRYEGANTLSYYLRRRDTLRALARDMGGVPESAVVALAMRQLLTGLAALHSAGLVHRDVKPLNVILSERDRRLKLIDLGAAADLRGGTNWTPGESILDPMYCPPEQYVLPTDSPSLSGSGALSLAISPMLWAQHKPDRFDTWSAGIVLMQLALPGLRSPRGLALFKQEYEVAGYDMEVWRSRARWVTRKDTALLDADDGAGWALAQALLRPRSIEVGEDGSVAFVSDGNTPTRMAAAEALRSPFLRAAAQLERELVRAAGRDAGSAAASMQSVDEAGAVPAPPAAGLSAAAAAAAARRRAGGLEVGAAAARRRTSSLAPAAANAAVLGGGGEGSGGGRPQEQRGLFAAAATMWRGLTDRLFDVEARILQQTSETAKQTTTVRKLQQKVAQGRADEKRLEGERAKLGRMQAQLAELEVEANETQGAANSLLRFLGLGGGGSGRAGSAAAAASSGASSGRGSARAGGGVGGSGRGGARSGSGRGAEPATVAASAGDGGAAGGGAAAVWDSLSRQLMWLERQLRDQESATARQRVAVKQLRDEVAEGQGDARELQRQEAALSGMDAQLARIRSDYESLWGAAAGLVKAVGGGGKEAEASSAGEAAPGGGSSKEVAGDTGGDKPRTSVGASGGGDSTTAAAVALAKGASSAFFVGLKFSGFAMKMAQDVVEAVRDDAGRMMQEMEAEAEAKRLRRAADAALLQLLRDHGEITATSSFDAASQHLRDEPAWRAVADPFRRRQLFAAYQEAAAKLEAATRRRGETALAALLGRLGVGADARWDEFAGLVAMDPDASVLALADQQRVFAEVRAAAAADFAYRQLLADVLAEPVTWAVAKPQLWSDLRFQVLAEARARQLFEEYSGALKARASELASAGKAAAPKPAAAPPPALSVVSSSVTSSGELDDGLAPEDLAQLQLLRWQQAQLRAECEAMEAKLREMESRLAAQQEGPGGSRGVAPAESQEVADMQQQVAQMQQQMAQRGAQQPGPAVAPAPAGAGAGSGSSDADKEAERLVRVTHDGSGSVLFTFDGANGRSSSGVAQ